MPDCAFNVPGCSQADPHGRHRHILPAWETRTLRCTCRSTTYRLCSGGPLPPGLFCVDCTRRVRDDQAAALITRYAGGGVTDTDSR